MLSYYAKGWLWIHRYRHYPLVLDLLPLSVHSLFDGAGNVIGSDTVSASNGVVEPRRATGTYTVRQDCTSSFTVEFSAAVFAGTVSANGVIVNKGEEIQAIQTDPAGGVVLTFVAKKV
jgi:hypothetical protein